MIRQPEIWECIKTEMPKSQWVSLDDIYHLVKNTLNLDKEDYAWQSPNSDIPKWKRNIRNVLQYRKKTGDIEWDGYGHYRL